MVIWTVCLGWPVSVISHSHRSASAKMHLFVVDHRVTRRSGFRKRLSCCTKVAPLAYDPGSWPLCDAHVASSDKPAVTPAERLDVAQLGALVRQHRGAQSLRQAAAEAGVS